MRLRPAAARCSHDRVVYILLGAAPWHGRRRIIRSGSVGNRAFVFSLGSYSLLGLLGGWPVREAVRRAAGDLLEPPYQLADLVHELAPLFPDGVGVRLELADPSVRVFLQRLDL